ncbi:MAG: hypothetical protein KGH64_02385 [Candidatus Micrarchaeota archaeon]|nr:hypothetical protein [Candidatus Micrarchaeota archaeon]MDE1834163.1 hypothetical protein [Candidatus Micrarchaeota archaeon]MDE1858999.1 hypothetical protein [Candidatus Micrarchaeota archaeon]
MVFGVFTAVVEFVFGLVGFFSGQILAALVGLVVSTIIGLIAGLIGGLLFAILYNFIVSRYAKITAQMQ